MFTRCRRRQMWDDASGPDDCRHHGVHFGKRRDFFQWTDPAQDFSRNTGRLDLRLKPFGAGLVQHYRITRLKAEALFQYFSEHPYWR